MHSTTICFAAHDDRQFSLQVTVLQPSLPCKKSTVFQKIAQLWYAITLQQCIT